MDRSDEMLAAGARAGDAAAFDELARRHRPGLVRLAGSIIGDADEAQSLAQEALTRALTLFDGYDAGRPFGPWVRGIVLNLCRNQLRDRRRRAKPIDPRHFAGTAAPGGGRRRGVLSAIIRQETNELTLQAVAQLPLPLREAFVLRFVEGMDYAEISQVTGLNPATLRVRAHRARALLRDSLGSVVDTWLRQSPSDPPVPAP
jgi:RNA polymerase sigma-70 factor (ECF subfamily)